MTDHTAPDPALTESLLASVRAWIDDDPDPADRDELTALLDAGDTAELADRFSGPLTFGTAGLRGPLRAGPNGMNLAVVRQAAAGLIRWLLANETTAAEPIVIGYDARRGSKQFAEETARVATGAGLRALVMPRNLPTPLLAFAVRHLGGSAGVMVTASHNPPQDNGYKVYLGARLGGALGAGAQIVPPVDGEISDRIAAVTKLADVPLGDAGELLDESIVTAYLDRAASTVDADGPRDLVVAYTPMHGVGGQVAADAFVRAGFAEPHHVDAQWTPDGTFPTVSFPNPEEPGAMDRVIALAKQVNADIAIASDPDADRCAVAIPAPASPGGWRMLRGDEVGVLLADHLMRRGRRGTYATTIVSSSLLKTLTAERGLGYAETLTGFKWISRSAADLCFGYEEALGYCVDPDGVRDKDGITAALVVAELAAGLKAERRTLADRLDEIAAQHGVYATDQLSVRVDDLTEISDAMARLRSKTPTTLLDEPVSSAEDLLPDADVVILRTGECRVVVRPSGTEPKLKAYLEVREAVVDGDLAAARERASAALTALRTETAAALGIWSVAP
ncbi:phospho-sugar mutase [Hamadaea sp. NPDC051192]|uniref:phospho-sugar mutase n=1 Tax=Hamadaea sp. NPDC051192 TaxID=3154940 RepID=UPI003419D49C